MPVERTLAASVFCAALSVAALVNSAQGRDVQDQIRKLEVDRAAAVIRRDVATFEKQLSDDFTIIHADGQMTDKVQTVNAFKSGQVRITSFDLSDLKVRVYDDAAVITGKADVKGTVGGQDISGLIRFTRVWVKKDGRWQAVAYQQTYVKNP